MALRRCRQAAVLAVVLCGLWPSAALAAPGDLDPSFGSDGKLTTDFGGGEDGAGDVALQPDGKLVVAGWDSDDNEFVLARYDADGTLDTTFGGGDGITKSDLLSYGEIAVMPDGSIMVASGNGDFILARYTSAGALDTSFGGGDGIVQVSLGGNDYPYGMVLQGDGKLLLGGEGGATADFALARYNPDGNLDTGFGGGDGKVTTDFGDPDTLGGIAAGEEDGLYGLALGADGKIVAVGGTSWGGTSGNEYDFAIARYNPDGTLDTSFAGDGTTTLGFDGFDYASAAAVQPNGKVVLAGTGVLAGKMHVTLVRYLTSGVLDPGFGGGDGIVMNDLGTYGSGAGDLVLQADGRIVVSGSGGDFVEDFLIVRYNPSGSLDTTFGDGDGLALADFKGDADWAYALALQPDGKIVAAGEARNPGTYDDEFAIARFIGGGAPPAEKEDPAPPPEETPTPPPSGSESVSPPTGTTPPASSGVSNTAKKKALARKRALAKCKKRKGKARRKCVKRVTGSRKAQASAYRRLPHLPKTVYPVSITIRHRNTGGPTCLECEAFYGIVRSPKPACERGREVNGMSVFPKSDPQLPGEKVESDFRKTDSQGRWERLYVTPIPLVRATTTASVEKLRLPSGAICKAARASLRGFG